MISVCIATHNGGKYIKEELESILPQLSEDDEVVISDDGSIDNTINVINSIGDLRVRIIHCNHSKAGKKNHYYVTKNFENAIINSRGDYIFLADQDDVWEENKIEICLQMLQSNDLVIHNLSCVDSTLNPMNRLIYEKNFVFKNYFILTEAYYGCAMAFKRKILSYILPFPKNLIIHDYWIGILSEILGHVSYVDIPLVKYRLHEQNCSSSCNVNNSVLFKIKYRIYTICCYIVRVIKYKFTCKLFVK